jgi:hypothetical protein
MDNSYKVVAPNKIVSQAALVPAGTQGNIDFYLDRAVSARWENFSVFIDGKLVSPETYKRFDKDGHEIIHGSEFTTGFYPFIDSIRLSFSAATNADQFLTILYNVFSGDWVDYKEIEVYAKNFLDLHVSTGNFSTELKAFIQDTLEEKAAAELSGIANEKLPSLVSAAITSANIPGHISNAISAEDIPGQVSTAVSSAISTANIPSQVDTAVDGALLVLQGDLEDYVDAYIVDSVKTEEAFYELTFDTPSVITYVPSFASTAYILTFAQDSVDPDTVVYMNTLSGNAQDLEIGTDPLHPADVSSFKGDFCTLSLDPVPDTTGSWQKFVVKFSA